MTYKVLPVPPESTAKAWPQVAPFLAKALDHGEDYDLAQIRMFINLGQWLLLVSVDEANVVHGAMTISFINYPNDRVAFITTTGGKGICTKGALQEVKNIVASMGATKIQAGARPSMVRMLRLMGFNERYMVVETEI
jgi:hypothetical protein